MSRISLMLAFEGERGTSRDDVQFSGECSQSIDRVPSVRPSLISGWLIFDKLLHHSDVMTQHGPLMIFSAVLLLAGLNMLAVGLLGEMQVRHYHEPTQRAPYSIDRVVRAQGGREHDFGVVLSTRPGYS